MNKIYHFLFHKIVSINLIRLIFICIELFQMFLNVIKDTISNAYAVEHYFEKDLQAVPKINR